MATQKSKTNDVDISFGGESINRLNEEVKRQQVLEQSTGSLNFQNMLRVENSSWIKEKRQEQKKKLSILIPNSLVLSRQYMSTKTTKRETILSPSASPSYLRGKNLVKRLATANLTLEQHQNSTEFTVEL